MYQEFPIQFTRTQNAVVFFIKPIITRRDRFTKINIPLV